MRITGEASDQYGKDASQEDAIEGPGAPDRGDRSTRPLQSAQVHQIGAHEDADAAPDIGQCRGISAC